MEKEKWFLAYVTMVQLSLSRRWYLEWRPVKIIVIAQQMSHFTNPSRHMSSNEVSDGVRVLSTPGAIRIEPSPFPSERRQYLALVFVFILCCGIFVFPMNSWFCCVKFSFVSRSQEIVSGMNDSEITYFMLSGTLDLNSVNH